MALCDTLPGEERTGYRLVNGHLESYTYTVSVPYEVYEPYEVEVEYEYKILNTTLTNNGISAAVSALNLTQDQMERYTLLLETRATSRISSGIMYMQIRVYQRNMRDMPYRENT